MEPIFWLIVALLSIVLLLLVIPEDLWLGSLKKVTSRQLWQPKWNRLSSWLKEQVRKKEEEEEAEEEVEEPSRLSQRRWQELTGQPILHHLAESSPAEPAEQTKKTSPLDIRWPLLVTGIALIGALLLLAPYLKRRPPSARPHRVVIVVTRLEQGSGMGYSDESTRASRDLVDQLWAPLSQTDMAPYINLRYIDETPTNGQEAYELAKTYKADLTLWGWVQLEGSPQYVLTLTTIPRVDEEVPEFEEFYRLWEIPPQMQLNRPGQAEGFEALELVKPLTWLCRFYLGEFDEIQDQVPNSFVPSSISSIPFTFHWGALKWLQGEYEQANRALRGLVNVNSEAIAAGEIPPCTDSATPSFCAAVSNDLAVVIFTRESIGQLNRSALREASLLLERARKVMPDSPTVLYNQGEVFLARWRWAEAKEPLERMLQADPDNARVLAALCEAYTGLGDWGRASSYAHEALKDRTLAEPQLAYGRYLLRTGQVDEASEELTQAGRLAEAESKRRRSYEVSLGEGPRPNTRRATFAEAWARRSKVLSTKIHLAQADRQLQLGRKEGEPNFLVFTWRALTGSPSPLEKALAETRYVLEKEQHLGWFDAYYLQGEIFAAQKAFSESVSAFQSAIDQDPMDPIAYQGQAQSYIDYAQYLKDNGQEAQAQQALTEAGRTYQQLIRKNIDPPRGYFGLGHIAEVVNNLEDAKKQYAMAVQANPDYGEAYLRWGLIEKAQGHEETALEKLEKAVEKKGYQEWIATTAWIARGGIYLEQYLRSKAEGRANSDLLDLANREFSVSGDESNYWPEARNGLGRVAYEQQNYNKAADSFLKVLQTKNRSFEANYEANYGMGLVLLAREDSAGALGYLKKAVAAKPTNISAQYYLGTALYAQLQEDQARVAFQTAVDLCTSTPPVTTDDVRSCELAPGWLSRVSGAP